MVISTHGRLWNRGSSVPLEYLRRSLSDIALRDKAKEVRLDAQPQLRKTQSCIRWNTVSMFS